MRRLSIVDLAGGNQPLFDESGKIVLFYNGEIYNSPALRAELEAAGVSFRTQSDGEVICHLYRKFGKDFFHKLDGMFAVALWDDEKETLLLVRDFPGEKPLYFARLAAGGVAFSSEIQSLLQCREISRELDRQSIWDFPTFLWIPEPRTVYREVQAVMPGTGWEISRVGVKEFRFRERIPTPDLPISSDRETLSSVRAVVEEAIRSRLLSDVPMGAFLSGGLDSSIVVMQAHRQLPDLQTFSIGFENVEDPYHGTSDESEYAAAYARQIGTKHHTIRATEQSFRNSLVPFIRAAGQPYAVSSGLGIMAVAAAAREQGIKVLLSGDGADEAFGGYSWYPAIPSTMGESGSEQPIRRYLDRGGTMDDRVNRMRSYPAALKAWAWHFYGSEEEKASLFHADFQRESSLRWFARESLAQPLDYIRLDREFYFPNEMLSKLDRMTMAHSVEGRAPFAAPAVQKFAGRLPWNSLVRGSELKWALRRAFANDLPSEIVERPKHGFNVPIDHWLKSSWSDLLEETFAPSSPLVRERILARDAGARARVMLNDPKNVNGHVIFCFVMLHLWWNQK